MDKKNYLMILCIIFILSGIIALLLFIFYVTVWDVPVAYLSSRDSGANLKFYMTDVCKLEKDNYLYVVLSLDLNRDRLVKKYIEKLTFSHLDDFKNEYTEILLKFNPTNKELDDSFIYSTLNNNFPDEMKNTAQQLKGNTSYEEILSNVKLINEKYGLVFDIPQLNLSKIKCSRAGLDTYFNNRKDGLIE